MRRLIGPKCAIIGVGGIDSVDSAWDKIAAGANIVQFYTGLVFRGPSLANDINKGLSERLEKENIPSIGELTGRDCDVWADKPLSDE